MLEGKTCSLGNAFTTSIYRISWILHNLGDARLLLKTTRRFGLTRAE